MTLEDLSGSLEFPSFGQQYLDFEIISKKTSSLYVTASVELSRFRNNEPELRIRQIMSLDDVVSNMIKQVTVVMPIEELRGSSGGAC